jgi:hypothetical protein
VTTYDKEDPRIHLWDLRRPHVPFREFDRYDVPASDLLWHSKDLLWTVGEAGAFTQTDVRYAPAVINRRPMCSAAWSPNGEFVAFAQPRPRRRALGPHASEFLRVDEEESVNGEKSLSQSPAEDIIDEVVLASSFRPRQNKSTTIRPSKSLGSTPPGAIDVIPVLPLDEALAKIARPAPNQLGAIGTIPGATNDASVFRFLASHYSPLMNENPQTQSHAQVLNSLLDSFDQNAESADNLSLTKLAQTWRIVKSAILQELQRRSRENLSGKDGLKGKTSKDGLLVDKSRAADESRPGKMKSRLFKGVMEAEGQKGLLHESESTSNMTTPLAQPIPDSPQQSWGSSTDSQIPSVNENAIDLDPLPPSVLSSQNGWSMSDTDVRSIHHPLRLTQEESLSSNETHISTAALPQRLRDPLQPDLDDEQRSAPRAIAGRSDWRTRTHPDFPPEASEDDYDQKLEEKRAAISNYKQNPRKVLTLESPMETNRPPIDRFNLNRHDSSESFPMFSASTDSSHPSKSIAASYSSNRRLSDGRMSDGGQAGSYPAGRPAMATRRESNLEPSPEEPEEDFDLEESILESDQQFHLERPSTPPSLVTESTPLEQPGSENGLNSSVNGVACLSAYPGIAGIYEDPSQVMIPLMPDAADLTPWSIEALMKEAVRYYHSTSSSVDIQTAAHLLQKLHVLFEDCEDILPYEECELVFKIYNEHLIRHSMDLEAAELRLSCVPSYPGVYDYAQADTFINVYCYTCQRPFENPRRDNTRCHRCNTPQAPCSICMSLDPPPEWVAAHRDTPSNSGHTSPDPEAETVSHLSDQSASTEPVPTSEIDGFTAPRPKGSSLWSWCQGCGHGGHVACMTTWLGDLSMSEGGCATPGCTHDCGPGPRRELNRQMLVAETKRRDSASRSAGVGVVKHDPWTKGESKAVQTVRGMLGAAGVAAATGRGVAGAGQGGQASGAVSPKKVRLVTPVEQGRRKGAAGRSGTAPE